MKYQVIVNEVQQATILRGMIDALRVNGKLRQVLVVETDSELLRDLAIAMNLAGEGKVEAVEGDGEKQPVSFLAEKPRRGRRSKAEMEAARAAAGGAGDTQLNSSARSAEGA